jgi:hypothetical protein
VSDEILHYLAPPPSTLEGGGVSLCTIHKATLAIYDKLSQNLVMENMPQSETPRYTDVLATLADHTDFMQQITNAEEIFAQIDPEETLPSEPLEELDELLDLDGSEVAATFSGIAYKVDDREDEDDLIDEPIMLTDQSVVFGGANYYFVDDTARVFFDLRDESTEPATCYAARFESILRLHCEKVNVTDILERHIAVSRGMTSNPEFLASDREEQEELLKAMAMACHEQLAEIIDAPDNSIECSLFYEHADDPNENELLLEKIDQTDVQFEDRTAVTGIIVGVIYPEVVQQEQAFTSEDDFIYGGVPCLAVRNHEAGITTFIPIDRIEKIESND